MYELIPLPGHTYDMVGFRSFGDVVYLADCLSSRETTEKYRVNFLMNAGDYLATLEKVKAMEAACFVPAHAKATDDIAELAQYNIDTVLAIADDICGICREPVGFDQLLKALFDEYGLIMTAEQHALVGSTVRSYLTWLQEEGRIAAEFAENMQYYRSV